jgi:hypothetical protein
MCEAGVAISIRIKAFEAFLGNIDNKICGVVD